MYNTNAIICLHGFGVRGWFFDPIKRLFQGKRFILAPDLDALRTLGRTQQALHILKENSKSKGPCFILGHSLGGVIAVLAANTMQNKVAGLILIATPLHGPKGNRLTRWFQKFLIKRKLIPDSIAWPKFFSDITDHATQKAFFTKVVQEPPTLIDEVFQSDYPHIAHLCNIRVPTLCIGSYDDRTVSTAEIKGLAQQIPNAELWLTTKLNHSELIYGPTMHTKPVFEKINSFLQCIENKKKSM
ncbi:MAG: alpha/beta fold hydrolase [Candidatus Ranarchaeia archaeon]